MPGRRKKQASPAQGDLLDITARLRTAPCVPALREAVKAWRAGGYKGVTETTRLLLNHWFYTDHRMPSGRPFAYHPSQQEAIETLIFTWECERVRTRKGLLERYAQDLRDVRLPPFDDFARYGVKMATGSGKTKIMALAVAWQFLNAQREAEEVCKDFAKTFLLIAPNVIVFDRLRADFEGGRIFRADPVIPKPLEIFWDFDCLMRGESERAYAEGTLFLTNIQQLYERPATKKDTEEPEVMTGVLGPKPVPKLDMANFAEHIALRAGNLLVINDEAHHTHDENNEWNKVIRGLHEKTAVAAQLDFSATPRFQKGGLFPWTIYDYPLKQAILDNIVKRPVKGIAQIQEAKSDIASVRYKGYLTAGVNRWREYREQLGPLRRRPILFVMLNSTKEAEDIGAWLSEAYPADFAGDKTLVIHTDTKGEITKASLEEARSAARRVDEEKNPINAIVSVLMLREGWDVQNVTVVVGLRPYAAKANILPEQTIGRGLRLMFRDASVDYRERVDIIGNRAFLEFVQDLEKLEEIKLDTFEVGKDRLKILTIIPLAERKEFDIGLPLLTPVLVRKKSLAEEIAGLNPLSFDTIILPLTIEDTAARETFRYEGYDIITLERLVERDYQVPEPQTAQEVIGFYARRIAEQVKLPSQFSALVPKVREFFELKAFGHQVDLESKATVKAMSTPVAYYVCVSIFRKELQALSIEERKPELLEPERRLSATPPFPWSRSVLEGHRTVFNLVPCENEFERAFAKFLDSAADAARFAKLPRPFGFAIEYTDAAMNLRCYYPDFVAVDSKGIHWLLETKGQESPEVAYKDRAADQWCENATALTGIIWRYRKIPQSEFLALQPATLEDLQAIR